MGSPCVAPRGCWGHYSLFRFLFSSAGWRAGSQKQVLLCGHSLLFWARKHAVSSSFGSQLGISGRACVSWLARRGMLWGHLIPMLTDYAGRHPPPQILLIHLGSNDLGQRTTLSLRRQASEDFVAIQQLWPGVQLLWSEQLPRRAWRHARSVRRIDVARKRLNAYIGNRVAAQGGGVVRHPMIGWKDAHLFRPDGVHLSNEGNVLFLKDLQQGILDVL